LAAQGLLQRLHEEPEKAVPHTSNATWLSKAWGSADIVVETPTMPRLPHAFLRLASVKIVFLSRTATQRMMANLVIANNEPLARRELREMLARLGHVVVGETSGAEQALVLARSLRPEAVVLDSGAAAASLLATARAFAAERLAAVIFLAGGEESARPEAIRRVSEAGVLALVRKPARPEDLEPAIAIAISRFREIAVLEAQVRTLTERMEARRLVGRAKAILMERQGLSEREAFTRIQTQSQALNKPAHEIAHATLLASDLALSLNTPDTAAGKQDAA